MEVAEQTFLRWKKKFLGMGVTEVRRPKVLEEENRKLKQLVADLSLDKQMLQDVLQKSRRACAASGVGRNDFRQPSCLRRPLQDADYSDAGQGGIHL